jgi:hypothetical protein
MPKETIQIYLSNLELDTIGSYSLQGQIGERVNFQFNKIGKLELVFYQTSTNWRKDNNNPDFWLLPEYVIPCLLESILDIQKLGIEVVIKTEERDPD